MKLTYILVVFAALILSMGLSSASERVGTADVTVCCEKTNSGLFCQDVLQEECSSSGFALPTACESTGPCDPGYCYDEEEGTCLDNVPQMVCNKEGGIWSAEKPAACNLGCCILGNQASFVTLVRCKRLSSFYGLEINYNPDIQNEALCILEAKSDERGACVFEEDFETTCKMTTRSQCTENMGKKENEQGKSNLKKTNDKESKSGSNPEEKPQNSPTDSCTIISDKVKFCPGLLCSAPELETNCRKSKETTCIEGKEEVYFVDTCGNPANIYDAQKINDNNYWTYLVDKSEACRPREGNINSQTCGNCNYLRGSYCAPIGPGTTKPTYGTNICIDLNCKPSEKTGGIARLHGESWCGFDRPRDFTFQETTQNRFTQLFDEALRNVRANLPVGNSFRGGDVPVGSKFYRYLCSHGEVIVEPCADFRQEECIENNVAGYSEAACVVNRWQDCTSVFKKIDCENKDQRDCVWLDGIEYVLMGGLGNGSTIDKSSISAAKGELAKLKSGERELGACVPKIAPGLKFWKDRQPLTRRSSGSPSAPTRAESSSEENSEAAALCAQANAICPVTYEKGLTGGGWKCIKNCECLDEGNQLKRAQLCMALGDCGPKVNIVGAPGRTKGYRIFEEELKKKK